MIAALSLLGPTAAQFVGDVAGNAVGFLQGPQPTAAAPTDFGSVLGQVASDAVNKLKTGESVAISGVEGKASVQQVVQSVMDAQNSLQTAIAVRDKVVAAYQEVTRMQI
jgi:flagellar hook-basal body complex protein FliE